MKVSLLVLFVLLSAFVGAEKKRRVTLQPFSNQHGVRLGPIGLGTTTQFQYMRLDTTADSFFLIDSACKTSGCTKNRNGYHTSKSTTFRELLRLPYSTTYQGVKSTGRIVSDKLTALGLGNPPRIVFPLVDRPAGVLQEGYGDGVLGLGFVKRPSLKLFTLFQLLSLLLSEPVFTFHMTHFNYTNTRGIHTAGLTTYGGNDLDSCTENGVVHKTSRSDQWTFNLKQVQFGGVALAAGEVLIRPGPQALYGPPAEVQKILGVLRAQKDPQSGDFFVPCSSAASLPSLAFTIDSTRHALKPADYLVPDLNDREKCVVLFAPTTPQIGSSPWFNVKQKTIAFRVPKTAASSS
ncbi:Peptidase A1 domain-containing protein [Aphelenchoides fujianensis]|nr:Peptidase A1 domain-containing protein [Aphelenchoides fujianensis]